MPLLDATFSSCASVETSSSETPRLALCPWDDVRMAPVDSVVSRRFGMPRPKGDLPEVGAVETGRPSSIPESREERPPHFPRCPRRPERERVGVRRHSPKKK